MGTYFNGRYWIHPGVYTYVNDTGLNNIGLTAANTIGMLGLAKEGKPNQGYLLTSTSDAQAIFGEGPLVEAASIAFGQGAQYIWAVRVGGTYNPTTHTFSTEPTQSTYDLTVFDLVSNSYGAHANGLRAKIDGNQAAGYNISVDAFGNLIETAKAVFKPAINVSFDNSTDKLKLTVETPTATWTNSATVGTVIKETVSGVKYYFMKVIDDGLTTGTIPDFSLATDLYDIASEVTVTTDKWMNIGRADSNTILKIIRTTTGDVFVSACKALMMNTYENMTDLANAITTALADARDTSGTLAAITGTTLTVKSNATRSLWLDAVSALTSTGGSSVNLTANMKGVFDWFAEGNQPFITSDDPDSNFSDDSVSKNLSLFTGSWVTLGGAIYGTAASVDATSYQGVLAEIFEDLDLDLIVPIVDDYLVWSDQFTSIGAAVFTQVYNHCKAMSETKSEERIGLIGYDTDNYETLMDYAEAMNTPYMTICAPRIKNYSLKGVLTTFNGTYTGAAIAGLVAGLPVGEPITNKVVAGIQGLSTVYKSREVIQLIDNGVCAIEKVVGQGYKVAQGVTTYIADDNFNRKEMSVRLVTNYVAKNCREACRVFIGRKNSPYIMEMVKGALVKTLNDLWNNDIIVGTADNPAYKNISLTADGDVLRVSFDCSPVLPLNYILISINTIVFRNTIG